MMANITCAHSEKKSCKNERFEIQCCIYRGIDMCLNGIWVDNSETEKIDTSDWVCSVSILFSLGNNHICSGFNDCLRVISLSGGRRSMVYKAYTFYF